MTIFIIARGIPSKQEPQWGVFEFDQAKALAKLGHKIAYLSVDRRFRLFHRHIGFTKQIIEGITVFNSFILPNALVHKLGEKVLFKFRVWQLNKLYQKSVQAVGKPDILYSHYLFVTQEAVALKQKYGVPLVGIEHWSELNKTILPPRVLHFAKSYVHVDQVIAVSNALQKTLKERFNINAIVVNNMVSDKFKYKQAISSTNKIRFISVGSLIQRKGFDLLIEAFNRLQLPKERWELNIIGSGQERNELSHQIATAHLEQNIHLLGSRTSDEIVDLLNQSDVFALPSRMETFGVVYIEAMACGLPVIATPCGGPEEFVTDSNGMLVPIDNVDELANAIQYMFNHYKEYHRETIAQHCREQFSSEVIAKQLTHIFEDAIAKSK